MFPAPYYKKKITKVHCGGAGTTPLWRSSTAPQMPSLLSLLSLISLISQPIISLVGSGRPSLRAYRVRLPVIDTETTSSAAEEKKMTLPWYMTSQGVKFLWCESLASQGMAPVHKSPGANLRYFSGSGRPSKSASIYKVQNKLPPVWPICDCFDSTPRVLVK